MYAGNATMLILCVYNCDRKTLTVLYASKTDESG